MFIRHVVADAPWHHSLLEGAKGVQLAELALESWKRRAWIDVPPLSLGGERAAPEGGAVPSDAAVLRKPQGVELRLPTARSRPRRVPHGRAEPFPDRSRAARSTAPPSPPRMSSPTRLPSTIPGSTASIDWDATIAYRRHLWRLGFSVAEAMDTAQRGMGLDWPNALELIRRSAAAAKADGHRMLASGAGTDHLDPAAAKSVDDVIRAYEEQFEAVEAAGSPIILMASRALVRVARSADDYLRVYDRLLGQAREPVIIHWLGDMFDPQLAGYWGSTDMPTAMATALEAIRAHPEKVVGHQDLAARCALGNRDAPTASGRRQHADRRRLQFRRAHRRRRSRAIPTRCSASSMRSRRPPPRRCRGSPRATRPASTTSSRRPCRCRG